MILWKTMAKNVEKPYRHKKTTQMSASSWSNIELSNLEVFLWEEICLKKKSKKELKWENFWNKILYEPQVIKKYQNTIAQDLEAIYPIIFMDAIHYHIRSEGQIVKKAVYI